MRYIKPFISAYIQKPGVQGAIEQVELAGRTSYKSEENIDEGTADKFLAMLLERGHLSPLEHGTIYLKFRDVFENERYWRFFVDNPYSFSSGVIDGDWYITTNLRVLYENNLQEVLQFAMDEPSEHHIKRYSYKVVCSRAISHEFVRHRALSFVQESTRYCNYSKNKFNNELTFIIPSWIQDIKDGETFTADDLAPEKIVQSIFKGERKEISLMYVSSGIAAENCYFNLLKQGQSPQQARDVLTNGLKTELFVTGTEDQWRAFLKLRSPKCRAIGVHPDMAVIADLIYTDLRDNHNFKKNVPKSEG